MNKIFRKLFHIQGAACVDNELLPVKRTVKQNKIVEQSVSYGTDCFYVSSDFVATTPTSRMNVAAKRSICRIHTSPSVSAHQDFSVIS